MLTVLATTSLTLAQPSTEDPQASRLDISGYAIEGRLLLEARDFTRIIASFIGRQKTAADIERAREVLQQAYHGLGHCSVKVTVARVEPKGGMVVFRLDEIPASEIRDCLPKVALEEQPLGRVETRGAQPETGPPSAAPATPVAEPGPAAAPRLEILRYVLDGNTLLTEEQLGAVVAPYTGKNKDFGDVQRALEALQVAYQEAGFGGVEIRLPEQELERGEVRFTVIEAKIRKITVEGNEHFSEANIRRSVPSLREGQTPNSREIAQSVRLANENPAKQQNVLLRGTEREDQIDATIRVADIDPERWSLSLDNTGNKNTGRLRLGVAFQYANVFDLDHVLTAQVLYSPQDFHDVGVYGMGYRIPLYDSGDSIDVVGGYSDVDSGTVQQLFEVSGKGSVFSLRYNQGLPRWNDMDHRITYGLDYRAFRNNVVPVGGTVTLVPDITVHPFSVTYSGNLRQEQRESSFYLSYVQNIQGGNDGVDEDFKNSRFLVGTASYRLYRFGGAHSRPLSGDWQIRIRLDAQYTEDALVTGEQIGIGGADNVRGFNERYTSNDKGARTNWEIYTPDMAKEVGFADGRLRFLAFYDTGTIRRNQPLSFELEQASLDSAGIGMRLSYKNFLTARLDVANIYHDGTQPPTSAEPNGRRNIKKVHFSIALTW